jgi:hypothetical protein
MLFSLFARKISKATELLRNPYWPQQDKESAPTEGSNCAVQISPLWGSRAFAIQVFPTKGLEVG